MKEENETPEELIQRLQGLKEKASGGKVKEAALREELAEIKESFDAAYGAARNKGVEGREERGKFIKDVFPLLENVAKDYLNQKITIEPMTQKRSRSEEVIPDKKEVNKWGKFSEKVKETAGRVAHAASKVPELPRALREKNQAKNFKLDEPIVKANWEIKLEETLDSKSSPKSPAKSGAPSKPSPSTPIVPRK